MAGEITLKGIEQAISGLNYRNKNSLKHRLLQLIRGFYETEDTLKDLLSIDSDELVRRLWGSQHQQEAILNKRKNLNSIKSSVNADLKKSFAEGNNPQGIIIGPTNVFTLSDEAKDLYLKTLKENGTGDGPVELERITDLLNGIDDILANSSNLKEAENNDSADAMEKINTLLQNIVHKFKFDSNDSDGPSHGGKSDSGEDPERNISEGSLSNDIGIDYIEKAGNEDTDETVAWDDEDVDVIEEMAEEDIDETVALDDEEVELIEELDEANTDETALPSQDTGVAGEPGNGECNGAEVLDNEDIDVVEEVDEDDIINLIDDDPDEDSDLEPRFEDDLEDTPGKGTTESKDEKVKTGDIPGSYSVSNEVPTSDSISEGAKDIQKARLLSEAFNKSLSEMDRFYNQYILIPEGEYVVSGTMGPQLKGQKRADRTIITPSFYFGKFPVTNALFEIFVEKTGYTTTAEKLGYGRVYWGRSQKMSDNVTGHEKLIWNAHVKNKIVEGAFWYQPFGPGSTIHRKRNHPVTQVSLEDAIAFAAWTGKRLPTENEWEIASRTKKGYVFPWGARWQTNGCNVEESNIGDTAAVDQYIEFANNFGIIDTLGNVMEWTSDRVNSPCATGKECVEYIAKGGSWISSGEVLLTHQFQLEPESHSNILGFRCVAF